MNERSIFMEALAQETPAQRSSYLDEACGGDAALRQRVEALLASHEGAGSFLGKAVPERLAEQRAVPERPAETRDEPPAAEEGPASGDATTTPQPIAEGPGSRVGPYKLLQEIGEGGMGTVYLAEQSQPVRRMVALKIIKPGMDSRQVIARFEAERQALALMDHPNIARVLDAGTTENGRPYFVMELVKGVPITRFCDEHRLTPRQRLELFVPVCQAVQHAHQKGIIHRDIKPSNMLVCLYDGRPVPKVIDFGIAKATGQKLTERTMFTEIGQVVGTLEYMSPEQAELNQLDIDTRSDIYSLGVLLYELLTGSTPLDRKRLKEAAVLEVLRLIREEEPPRPSTRLSTTDELPSVAANRGLEPKKLSGLVRGELDWVVMKCLDKDRSRRYETANGLALDLQRYLHDEAVQACPPSSWYRFRKFARRNKAALTAGALVLVTLVLGIAVSTWQAVSATQARDAEREARDALDAARDDKDRQRTGTNRKLSEALVDAARLREKARTARPGDTEPAGQLSATLRRAEALAGSDLADPVLVGRVKVLLAELKQAEANRRMAARLEEIRLNKGSHRGGQIITVSGGTRPAYEAAFREFGLPVFQLSVKEAARRIAASAIREELLAALDDCASNNGELIQRLLPIARRVARDPWQRRYFEARIRNDRSALLQLAKEPEALAQPPAIVAELAVSVNVIDQRAAVNLLREAQRRHPADMWINFKLADILRMPHYSRSHGPAERQRLLEEAIGYQRAALATRPNSPALHKYLAGSFFESRRYEDAVGMYRRALLLNPADGSCSFDLGLALGNQGKLDKAISAVRRAIAIDPKSSERQRWLGSLGGYLAHKGDFDGAIAAFRQGGLYREMAVALCWEGKSHETIAALRIALKGLPDSAARAWAYQPMAVALCRAGKFDEAKAALRIALKGLPDPAARAFAYEHFGQALLSKGKLHEAFAACKAALELSPGSQYLYGNLLYGVQVLPHQQLQEKLALLSELIKLQPQDVRPREVRALLCLNTGQKSEALKEYSKLVELQPKSVIMWQKRAQTHDSLGQHDKAIADYNRAIELKPDFSAAWFGRGRAQMNLKKWPEAIADLSSALALNPGDYVCRWQRGYCYVQQGQPQLALADFSRGLQLQPNAAVFADRGNVHRSLRRWDQAIADYTAALKLNPGFPAFWFYRGLCYAAKGEHRKAAADFSQCIQLNSKVPACWFNRGNAWLNLGRKQKALADYSQAIALKSDFQEAWISRGHVYKALGQWKEALANDTAALQRHPQLVAVRFQRGLKYAEKGQLDKAVADFTRVIAQTPADFAPWRLRGVAHQRLGQWDKALADFAKVLDLLPQDAVAYNELAWLLATCPEAKYRRPVRAVELARKAVELAPKEGGYWNTLGVAQYRAGAWQDAAATLGKSRQLRQGGDACDWFFLAMAHAKSGRPGEARKAYGQARQWLKKNAKVLAKDPLHAEEFHRFKAEAEEVLQVKHK
jgi:tetratricopeptide (TPR) repeat protein